MTAFQKLSAYTYSRNCTDLTDCQCGYDELREYLKKEQNPPKSARIRFAKLARKIEQLTTSNIK